MVKITIFFAKPKSAYKASQKYWDYVKKNVTFDFLVLGLWKSIGTLLSTMLRSSLNFSPIRSITKKLRFFNGEILTILSYFAHIFPIYLYRKKYEMYEKHMQLILFVEICSKMSSRMIFWWNKSIFTLIWITSIYTQMSQNPNHYLEPCHTLLLRN